MVTILSGEAGRKILQLLTPWCPGGYCRLQAHQHPTGGAVKRQGRATSGKFSLSKSLEA